MSVDIAKIRLRKVPDMRVRYEMDEHRTWPHVLKFSGGRSSAMLLVSLLKNRQLKPSRGDVVVFNNTSAEHPATYEFASTCKRIAEERYNIPFFWIEFKTYEDARRGRWSRIPNYRLVKDHPFAENRPYGYRYKGEVFEEMLSWKQRLPNHLQRLCTQHLKLETTISFLGDWFASKSGTSRLGHWYGRSKVNSISRRDLKKITSYHLSTPVEIPAQKFRDYTRAGLIPVRNSGLRDKSFGGTAELNGDNPVDFVTLVGLRSDEFRRVARVKARNNSGLAENDADKLAHGEHIYTPLADSGITKDDTMEFWGNQSWDLQVPRSVNFSNCVYCFMKGKKALMRIIKEQSENPLPARYRNSPVDIAWWIDIEDRYARRVSSTKKENSTTRFGFFGANSPVTYASLYEDAADGQGVFTDDSMPCDCTD